MGFLSSLLSPSPPLKQSYLPPTSTKKKLCRAGWFSAASRGDTQILLRYLRHGQKIEAKTTYGRTALFLAAESGAQEAVRALLEAGANPNVVDQGRYDDTPLHRAAYHGFVGVVRALLDHMADVHVLNSNGRSAHMLATIGHGIPDGGQRCDNRLAAQMIEAAGGGSIGLGMPLVHGSLDAPPPLRVVARARAARSGPAEAGAACSAGTHRFAIICPLGAEPGNVLCLGAPGCLYDVTLPESITPGATLDVDIVCGLGAEPDETASEHAVETSVRGLLISQKSVDRQMHVSIVGETPDADDVVLPSHVSYAETNAPRFVVHQKAPAHLEAVAALRDTLVERRVLTRREAALRAVALVARGEVDAALGTPAFEAAA